MILVVLALLEAAGAIMLREQRAQHLRSFLIGSKDTSTYPRVLSHPYSAYMLTPEFSEHGGLRHNADGYRGDPVPFFRDTSKLRILFMGGSTTYTWMADHADSTLPQLVRAHMEQHEAFKGRVEVMNAGMPGGTSAEILTQYLMKYRYYQPDIAVLHTGGNDALAYLYAKAWNPFQADYTHWRNGFDYLKPWSGGKALLLRSRFLSAVVLRLGYRSYLQHDLYSHSGNKTPAHWYRDSLYMEVPEQAPFYRNISTAVREMQHDGVRPLLVPFIYDTRHPDVRDRPAYRDGLVWHADLLQQVSGETGAAWCGMDGSLIADPGSWKDSCHLDHKGTDVKAAKIAEALIALLDRPAAAADPVDPGL